MSKIKTTCSACRIDVEVDTDKMVVSTLIPSNGVRGSGHVPAHFVESDLYGDEDLWQWDCPACCEADSYDPNFHRDHN